MVRLNTPPELNGFRSNLSVDVSYSDKYRVPTIKELQTKTFNILVCNSYWTLDLLFGDSRVSDKPHITLSILSGYIIWSKPIQWQPSFLIDMDFMISMLEHGLLITEYTDNDLIKVWVKKSTSALKDPWIYTWTYWSYLYWKSKLSTFHNPDDIISVVFDENIALYEIIKNF
jgi:hypothetical protein